MGLSMKASNMAKMKRETLHQRQYKKKQKLYKLMHSSVIIVVNLLHIEQGSESLNERTGRA